jgi:hypothetical protein
MGNVAGSSAENYGIALEVVDGKEYKCKRKGARC